MFEIICYLILAIAYNILIIFVNDLAMLILLMLGILPIIVFIVSIAYGIKYGFKVRYFLIAAGLFLPAFILYFRASAYMYLIVYIVLALLGNLIGAGFRYAFTKKSN